ncbi:MAG: glycosyltransferase [Verrucomicrobiales bacterium]|nr:glycosyltransferase [Verrucomicrobiales bacterium]
MNVLIVYPEKKNAVTGNFCSARQYKDILTLLGHNVTLSEKFEGQRAELLIAINAEKKNRDIVQFAGAYPDSRIIVILSGTDIYPEPSEDSILSMQLADSIIVLQNKGIKQVPGDMKEKVHVIIQSVVKDEPVSGEKLVRKGFDVALVSNLRQVKDPFLAAEAARKMPQESELRILHAGFVLDPGLDEVARNESIKNERYRWLGGLDSIEARELIRSCNLLTITSKHEGAGRVVGEAIVNNVPVISTCVDGVTGVLGDDYEGLFPVGDASSLAMLFQRAEMEDGFLDGLKKSCMNQAFNFDPATERNSWNELLENLF